MGTNAEKGFEPYIVVVTAALVRGKMVDNQEPGGEGKKEKSRRTEGKEEDIEEKCRRESKSALAGGGKHKLYPWALILVFINLQ